MTAPDFPVPAPSVGPTDKPTTPECTEYGVRGESNYPPHSFGANLAAAQASADQWNAIYQTRATVVQRTVTAWVPVSAPVGGGQRDNTE